MSIKKDKEKVIDPVWGEERIREFLSLQPPSGENGDHHKLVKAYQSMRIEDFDSFVEFFVADNGNLDACDSRNQSFSELISTHRYSQPYLDIIKKYRP
tara:strand:+ start:311 stop:604 length:294 start_codon:yes stop_codon:yes gene_type:complete